MKRAGKLFDNGIFPENLQSNFDPDNSMADIKTQRPKEISK